MNFCSNCGAPATGTAYCGNCGQPMAAAAASRAGRAGPSPQGTTPEPGATSAGPRAVGVNPFADIPVLDYARDIVALVLLLVSFGMPWDLRDSASGKVYVILVTLLSVMSLALPYLKRGGVLPGRWGNAELRLARLAANVPYVVVVLVTLVLGYVGEDNGDGVGVGIAFGLAGALLAAQGRQAEEPRDGTGDGALWWWITVGVGALFALLTVISLILFFVDEAEGLEWEQITAVVLVMLFFLALAALPMVGVLRGDAAWRDVPVLLGAVALFVCIWQLSAELTMSDAWSLRSNGPRLLLFPALGVAVSAAGVRPLLRPVAGAARWIAMSLRMFQVVMLVAAFGVLLYTLSLFAVDDGRGIAIVVLVLHLILLVAAIVGHNALRRDPNLGRAVAIACAAVFILLGIVLASVLGASEIATVNLADATIISVLWWFGAALIVALTAPAAVRGEYGPVAPAQMGLGGSSANGSREADVSAAGATPAGATTTMPTVSRQDEEGAGSSAAVDRDEGVVPSSATAVGHERAGEQGRADIDQTRDPRWAAAEPSDADHRSESAHPDTDGSSADSARVGGLAATERPDDSEVPADEPGRVHGLAAARASGAPAEPETGIDEHAVAESETPDQAAQASSSGFDVRTASDPDTPLQVLADIAAQEPSLRPFVAANPSTYPELLTWLGKLGDPAVDEVLRRRGR